MTSRVEYESPGNAAAPPQPDALPLLGHTLPVMRDPFGFYETLAEHGDVVQYRTILGTFTALFHPEHVERVLVREPERFAQVDIGEFDIGVEPEGLVDVRGEQWRRQRTIVQPAFTMDRIRSYADAMVSVAEEVATDWQDGQRVTLNETFSTLTLRILTRSLFDIDVEREDRDDVIARASALFNQQLDVRNIGLLLPSWVPTPANRRFKRTYAEFNDRVDAMIADRRGGPDPGNDLLSILLDAEGESGDTLSEKELRDNMLTFLFAGHETTALGLTYTILLLANHDDVLDRMREEHEAVIGTDRPEFAHVRELEVTERIVDEALRLYPPVPVLFREPRKTVTFDGYRVTPETNLTLPQFWIHRDERFYDDPDAFEPNRWTAERSAERPDGAYFPFGSGPRHCIGMRFARLEMQLVLAVLGRRFDFDLLSDPDPDFDPGITLRPSEDVVVRVNAR